jgi:hypothetical protein
MQADSLAKDEYWNIKGWGRLLVVFCLNCFHFQCLERHHFEQTVVPLRYHSFSLFSCPSFQQVPLEELHGALQHPFWGGVSYPIRCEAPLPSGALGREVLTGLTGPQNTPRRRVSEHTLEQFTARRGELPGNPACHPLPRVLCVSELPTRSEEGCRLPSKLLGTSLALPHSEFSAVPATKALCSLRSAHSDTV